MDIYSRKIMSWHLDVKQSETASAKLIKETCEREGVKENELFIHSDNGGPMRGSTMLATLQKMGVIPSFSRPHVSNDNAFSESLFKTLKYNPAYPSKPFANIAEAKNWVRRFVEWYNNEHLHSQIGFVTPQCRFAGEDRRVMEQRNKVYEVARMLNPHRWASPQRVWKTQPFVTLNSVRSEKLEASNIITKF